MSILKRTLAPLLGAAVIGLPLMIAGQPAALAETIILKKADGSPATQTRSKRSKWWAEEIEKRSGGRVKIQYFPAGSLVNAKNMFEAVRSGTVDIGIWIQVYNPSVSPMSTVFFLPGVSSRFGPAVKAANELILTSKFSFYRDEMRGKGVEPLYVWGVSDSELIASKPLTGIASLKGMKVRVIFGWPKLISALGGTPVPMPWKDVYSALSRGTIDGNVGFVTANQQSKLYEVAKHHTRIHLGAPAGPVAIMNKKKWDGLPADIKKIIREVSREYPAKLAADYKRDVEDAMKVMKAKGVKFYTWPAKDRAQLTAAMKKVWGAWAKKMDDKGLPGSEALRRYLALQKKYAG